MYTIEEYNKKIDDSQIICEKNSSQNKNKLL